MYLSNSKQKKIAGREEFGMKMQILSAAIEFSYAKTLFATADLPFCALARLSYRLVKNMLWEKQHKLFQDNMMHPISP